MQGKVVYGVPWKSLSFLEKEKIANGHYHYAGHIIKRIGYVKRQGKRFEEPIWKMWGPEEDYATYTSFKSLKAAISFLDWRRNRIWHEIFAEECRRLKSRTHRS